MEWREEEGQNHSDDIEIAHAFEAGLRIAAIELESLLDEWDASFKVDLSSDVPAEYVIEHILGKKAS